MSGDTVDHHDTPPGPSRVKQDGVRQRPQCAVRRRLSRERTATAHPAINFGSWDPRSRIIPGDSKPEGDSAKQPPSDGSRLHLGKSARACVTFDALHKSHTRRQCHGTHLPANRPSPKAHRGARGRPPVEESHPGTGCRPGGGWLPGRRACASPASPGGAFCRSGSSVPASRRSPRSRR